ncbi:MAG: FAD-dependent oxidoreductase [Thermoplasmata archaeon]
MNKELLFSEIKVGSLTLKNRIIFPPISTNFADSTGNVNAELIHHYERRAMGGAAIITMENMCISYPDGRSGATQPRIDDDTFIPGLSRIAYSIHSHGSLAFMELTHPGLFAELEVNGGELPVSPSKVPLRKDKSEVKELTENEINNLAEKYARAAYRAKIAHFDGVEIEAAHGLLVNQFLSPYTNKRTDKFGISLENRVRFAKIIFEKIKMLCGQSFSVTARLPVLDFVKDGINLNEGVQIAKLFEEIGYNAVHADVGFGNKEKRLEPMQYAEGWRVYLAEALKQGGIKIPVIAVGMIRNPAFAEEILNSNKADLVALGRTLIADPDWPIKAESGRDNEIRRCIGCSECIKARHDEGTAIRCGVNPTLGKLESDELLLKSIEQKKILIVGAGIAGLEAAITAKRRGHIVEVWEKEEAIGGALKLAAVPPGKGKLNWLLEYYDHMTKKLGIPIKFNQEVTLDKVAYLNPDAIIIATGAKCYVPSIKGIKNSNIVPARNVLNGKIKIRGKKVVVGGGGLVGCETALYLATQDNEVTIVEMLPALATDMETLSRNYLLRELDEHNVKYLLSAPVNEITENSVIAGNTELLMDYFIISFGGFRDHTLYNQLKDKYETHIIGDALKVGKIIDAVSQGFSIGKAV